MSYSRSVSSVVSDALAAHISVIRQLEAQRAVIERIICELSHAALNGKTIFWCGNGGSAADAQHLAADLVGRFKQERLAIASIALTTDSSILTAIANDYGYEQVFCRQIEALCREGDVLVATSTSGNSVSVCKAVQTARRRGAFTVALTGYPGGSLAALADVCLRIPSSDTARIQEAHILCGHIVCECVEAAVTSAEPALIGDTI